jgi:transcriptional regulator with XRE-family HTH domain
LDPNEDPVIQGRRLRAAIRAARVDAGKTQRDLATALDWSVSKVVRIENGDTGISTTDLRALLEQCDVLTRERVEELVRLARMSRRQAWAPYRDIFPRAFLSYLRLEASAATIRTFESNLVPGLLQTEEYAAAVIGAYRGDDASEVTIARLVQARMERQELLDRIDDHSFVFLIDESALRRRIGSSHKLMERQFEHLRQAAGKPNVTIAVVPFSAGQYSAMAGPFVHLEFSGPGDDDLVYLETGYGDFLIRDTLDETRRFLETFLELESIAAPADQLEVFLRIASEELRAER